MTKLADIFSVLDKQKVTATVNLRPTPTSTPNGSIPLGAMVGVLPLPTIAASVQGVMYNFQSIIYGESIGWIANKYLANAAPSFKPGYGLHVIDGGASGQVVALAQRLHAAGRPLNCVTVVNRKDIANALAPYVKYVVFRSVEGGGNSDNPDESEVNDGYKWLWYLLPKYDGLDARIYIQPANECTWFDQNNQFWLDAIRCANDNGRKLGVFGDAVGNPSGDHISRWKSREDALRLCKKTGHVVILHVYSKDGTPAGTLTPPTDFQYYEGRAAAMYAAVPDDARPPLVFGEAACEFHTGKFQGVRECVAWAKSFYEYVKDKPYVVGFCLWTTGNSGWADSSIDSALGELEKLFRGSL